jgi:hypothetical protein
VELKLVERGSWRTAGLEYDDGYNYWYSVEKNGATGNWFIERGKDFKNSFSFNLA